MFKGRGPIQAFRRYRNFHRYPSRVHAPGSPPYVGLLGDSIAGMAGRDFAEVLSERHGRLVVVLDRAAPESTTHDWRPGGPLLPRSIAAFTRQGVTAAAVLLGANDARAGVPPDDYAGRLLAVVRSLGDAGITAIVHCPIWLVGRGPLLAEYRERLLRLPGVTLGDRRAFDWFREHTDHLPDGAHPDDEGLRVLARLWVEAMPAATRTP